MSGQFSADKFGREPERAPVNGNFLIDSAAAAMRLDASAFGSHLVGVADVIEQEEMAAGYLIREAVRRLHEQEAEIERLKFHTRHLRKAASEAADYLGQLVKVSETPGARLQHVVFALASALSTSRNLQL